MNQETGFRRMGLGKVACFVAIAIVLFSSCSNWTEEQKKRQSMPDFHFENYDGEELQRSDLPENAPATIFYYDPGCDHCNVTLNLLVSELPQFGNNTLVIISSGDRDYLISKLSDLRLFRKPGVKIGTCEPQEFFDTFGTTQTPTVLFYGADRDLKRAYKGEMEKAMLMDALQAVRTE